MYTHTSPGREHGKDVYNVPQETGRGSFILIMVTPTQNISIIHIVDKCIDAYSLGCSHEGKTIKADNFIALCYRFIIIYQNL